LKILCLALFAAKSGLDIQYDCSGEYHRRSSLSPRNLRHRLKPMHQAMSVIGVGRSTSGRGMYIGRIAVKVTMAASNMAVRLFCLVSVDFEPGSFGSIFSAHVVR
jgi:hypothetical protein